MANHNLNNIPNNLINANSPYLLQHAYNPVSWEQWSREVWARAKSENKLVLLSIGYSTCHWCHVMEAECFEDFETAEIMNQGFINIKVDREERPDIDMIYMDACQIMTGRGGWPLNVICLPDQRPIYAGTYFPKTQWQNLLKQLISIHSNEPEKAIEYADKIENHLISMNPTPQLSELSNSKKELLEPWRLLSEQLDWIEGGPNRAPKFPLPGQYEFILDYHILTGDESAKDFLHLSLIKMANGGIYDTLRGGFCRYSTDAHWFAPHFEKMLYDNAQLISLYARSYAWSNAEIYQKIASESIAFCERELMLPNGLFGSALDADSEGIEGKYYVFTEQELLTVLNDEEFALAVVQFGIKSEGNWENGYNILHQPLAPLQVLEATKLDAQNYQMLLTRIKQNLKHLQDSRVRPSFDDKAICAWNGLMLKALSDAGFYLEDALLTQRASALGEQSWNIFFTPTSLLRIHRNNQTHIEGFLEDYAFLAEGYLALYKLIADPNQLKRVEQLCLMAKSKFWNPTLSILNFTSTNGEKMIVNKSDTTDDVIPSPNSIFAHVCFQLGTLTQNLEWINFSKLLMSQMQSAAKANPGWHFNWCRLDQAITMGGMHWHFEGTEQAVDAYEKVGPAAKLPGWTTFQYTKNSTNNQITVCTNHTCFSPVSQVNQAFEIAIDAGLLRAQPEN